MAMDLETMKSMIFTLLVVVLVAAAAGLALDAFRTSTTDNIPSTSVTNESVTFTNATQVPFATDGGVVSLTCLSVSNASDWNNASDIIGVANYTCSVSGITLTDVGGLEASGSIFVNYSYVPKTTAYNASDGGLEGLSNASSYFSTIGTMIGVAALIGIVITAFVFIRR